MLTLLLAFVLTANSDLLNLLNRVPTHNQFFTGNWETDDYRITLIRDYMRQTEKPQAAFDCQCGQFSHVGQLVPTRQFLEEDWNSQKRIGILPTRGLEGLDCQTADRTGIYDFQRLPNYSNRLLVKPKSL